MTNPDHSPPTHHQPGREKRLIHHLASSGQKPQARIAALQLRDNLAKTQGQEAADKACTIFMRSFAVKGKVVSAYWPMRGELSTKKLFSALHAAGAICALPVICAGQRVLEFRHFAPGQPLVQGNFKTKEPACDQPVLTPEIIVAPFLLIDPYGVRLGYGGGYYDTTIAHLRRQGKIIIVGYGFSGQQTPQIAKQAHDQPLDFWVNEIAFCNFSHHQEQAGCAARAR